MDSDKQTPRDGKFISPEAGWGSEYWARRFGVSRDRLVEAMEAVGHSAEKVRAYLTQTAADWRTGASMMTKRRRQRARWNAVMKPSRRDPSAL